jgi:small Trp-rich protein
MISFAVDGGSVRHERAAHCKSAGWGSMAARVAAEGKGMVFVILGVALLLMKLLEFGPVAAWDWWAVLAPFGLAVAWWMFSDSIGLTQRRAIRKMEATKVERRNRNLEALGLSPRRERKSRKARERFPASGADRRSAVDPTTAPDEPTPRG